MSSNTNEISHTKGIGLMQLALATGDPVVAHQAMAYFDPRCGAVDFTMPAGQKTVHISVLMDEDRWGLIDVLYQGQERQWPVFINEDPSLKWTDNTNEINVYEAWRVLCHLSQL